MAGEKTKMITIAERVAKHIEQEGSPNVNNGASFCDKCMENWPCTVAQLAPAADLSTAQRAVVDRFGIHDEEMTTGGVPF